MTILFEKICETEFEFQEEALIRKIVPYVLEQENCPFEAEVSILYY